MRVAAGRPYPKANGVPQGNTAYRSLTALAGDDTPGHRAQLGRNERNYGENTGTQTNGTFALYYEGERKITFFSLRFPTGSFNMAGASWQTIHNSKQTQPYGGHDLPGNALEIQLYGNRLRYFNNWVEVWRPPARL